MRKTLIVLLVLVLEISAFIEDPPLIKRRLNHLARKNLPGLPFLCIFELMATRD